MCSKNLLVFNFLINSFSKSLLLHVNTKVHVCTHTGTQVNKASNLLFYKFKSNTRNKLATFLATKPEKNYGTQFKQESFEKLDMLYNYSNNNNNNNNNNNLYLYSAISTKKPTALNKTTYYKQINITLLI